MRSRSVDSAALATVAHNRNTVAAPIVVSHPGQTCTACEQCRLNGLPCPIIVPQLGLETSRRVNTAHWQGGDYMETPNFPLRRKYRGIRHHASCCRQRFRRFLGLFELAENAGTQFHLSHIGGFILLDSRQCVSLPCCAGDVRIRVV